MKLALSSIFLLLFLNCSSVLGDVFFKKYIIYTSGIKIGDLNWEVKIENKNYSNNINLKSSGLLSGLYSFKGEYFSSGGISNKVLKSKIYKHSWKTKKINKTMKLIFNENKLNTLEQNPIEKEKLRLNIYEINHTKDPLSSFLQIIFGVNKTLVVDGRRFYTMSSKYNENIKETVVEVNNYLNLWADHKRRSFEKIIFKKNNDFLPSEIFIYFDARVFKLIEG